MTYLLAILDDALPKVLPTSRKILERISDHLLDRLLRSVESPYRNDNLRQRRDGFELERPHDEAE